MEKKEGKVRCLNRAMRARTICDYFHGHALCIFAFLLCVYFTTILTTIMITTVSYVATSLPSPLAA